MIAVTLFLCVLPSNPATQLELCARPSDVAADRAEMRRVAAEMTPSMETPGAKRPNDRQKTSSWKPTPLKVLELPNGHPARFGSIRFPGRQRPVRWVRCCSVKSGTEDLMDLLEHTWNLQAPGAIISGTAQHPPH